MKETTKLDKKKILKIVLGTLLAIVLVAVIAISIIAAPNVKAMNSTVDSAINTIKSEVHIIPQEVGEYEDLTVMGIMKFDVEQYYIKNLGNLSIMRMNMGVMQMATVVITPLEKNMPILSADYMYILGERKCYLEFYDVVEKKDDDYNALLGKLACTVENYKDLENIETSEAWYKDLLTVTSYKGGTVENDADLEQLLVDSIRTYITHAKMQFPLTEEEMANKLAITVEYTDGLIEKGGISTDVFKKDLGEKETKKFFDKVFFGTGNGIH